jgi:transposase
MTKELFDRGPDSSARKQDESSGEGGVPRLRVPERHQVEMHFSALDQLLEPDHPARAIWSAIEGLNLERWLKRIQSVEGGPGRNATDPRLLVAVWVYATLDGVGSARRLAKLCDPKHGQLGYRWLCGRVTLNYHTLSDFRVQQGNAWDELITQLVASLLHAGLVTMTRVAQDGMRVEANAGKSTFRRRETLQHCFSGKPLLANEQHVNGFNVLSKRSKAAKNCRSVVRSGQRSTASLPKRLAPLPPIRTHAT